MLPDTRALGLDPGRLGTALTAACRAPSLHNSQPWRFRVGPDVIADRGGSASVPT